ncbi:MAG: glutathione S-transferase family protein [Gammaproteobacteria bacterium]|nr:glutathione S-transferase family protein [Gammaproteobacteria bacterium]
MTTLYETFPTRSQRAKWILEEIGLKYDAETVNMRSGEHKDTEYTAVNPMQVVPTLETDTYKIHESVAVVLQLADEHPKANLAPAVGTADRARYYQWCVFGSAELDFPIGLITQNELLLPAEKRSESLAQLGRALFTKRATILSKQLEHEPYLLGDDFSGADIVIGYNCFWSTFSGLLDDHPVLSAYLERLQSRPAFQRAFAEPKA